MHSRIGVVGHLGSNENYCDGQTIKTKNLIQLLEDYFNFPLYKVDTYFFKTQKCRLLRDSLLCLFYCEHIFLMVSEKGMKFYLPFLYYLNKIFKKSIYHYIIGSELLEMVTNNKRLVKYLNALTVNWFEYESGTQYLQAKGVRNVSTLANFKLITPVSEVSQYEDAYGICRFCTFSRVMEEKGITDSIEAIRDINMEQSKIVATLDIYGSIDGRYESKFKQLLEENRNCVKYRGIVESCDSVATLKDYYALLFPTRWGGEGVPGTLIDAFAAGIPVIASDWNANKDLVHHEENGLIFPNKDCLTLKDAINWSISNVQKMNAMRVFSRKEYESYTPMVILKKILSEMEEKC